MDIGLGLYRGAINHSPGNDMESYSHPIVTPMEKLWRAIFSFHYET
jgi:hypothetical protein